MTSGNKMKKIYVLVALLAFAVAACKDDDNGIEGNVPAVVTEEFDEAFARELFNRGYITDPQDIAKIKEEVAGITELDVSDKPNNGELTSLKGIEYFSSLRRLVCSGNKLTALDVSCNTALDYLNCYYNNNLTGLDVSGCTALTELQCNSNNLTGLDVSSNTKLQSLTCSYNNLTELDVSSNTELEYLSCTFNNLTELDVSSNTKLVYLYCYNNALTTLDVSRNTALMQLSCDYNKLTELDVSNNTALTQLWCHYNKLTELDVSNNTALTKLWCYNNNLTELDVSNNIALTLLQCYGNPGSGGVFTVEAWFDDTTVPSGGFTTNPWEYNGSTVTIHYQKK